MNCQAMRRKHSWASKILFGGREGGGGEKIGKKVGGGVVSFEGKGGVAVVCEVGYGKGIKE